MTGRASLRLCRSKFWVGVFLLAIAFPRPGRTALCADDPTSPAPPFEVASIKVNKSGSGSSHSRFKDGRFSATNETVKMFIQYDAYGIPARQIVGGPAWVDSERFDVEAKADDQSTTQMAKLDQAARSAMERQMMQQLLADRFHLAVHWDTKEVPVYALVLAKGGPKFSATKDPEGHSGTSASGGRLKATAVTMTRLAETLTQLLSRELGRVVVDRTGLDGKYDLELNWSPDNGSSAFSDGGNNAASIGPSIFTALEEQLGLKLTSAKGPVRSLVIDHLEQPSEN
jgi:uncharacterized protein (TIGR03435 family)